MNLNRRQFWQSVLAMFGAGAAGIELEAGGLRLNELERAYLQPAAAVVAARIEEDLCQFAPGWFAIGDVVTFGNGPYTGMAFTILRVERVSETVVATPVVREGGHWTEAPDAGKWRFDARHFAEYRHTVLERFPYFPLALYPARRIARLNGLDSFPSEPDGARLSLPFGGVHVEHKAAIEY